MPHVTRTALRAGSAVHVTLGLTKNAPNLRGRRKFALVKRAFTAHQELPGFRIVHFAVLGDHIHLVCEADSANALSSAVQKITISLARLLNLDGIREAGGTLERRGTPLRERAGWIGKIFRDRYHVHHLASPTEIAKALRYVLNNAFQHYGRIDAFRCKTRLPDGRFDVICVDAFTSFAHQYAVSDPWKPNARGFLLRRAIHAQRYA
jgi:REP element-mobilizing transposase RayT